MEETVIGIIKSAGGTASVLMVVVVLYYIGLLDKIKRKNGVEKLEAEIKNLKENHLHTLEEKIDKLSDKIDSMNSRCNEKMSDVYERLNKKRK